MSEIPIQNSDTRWSRTGAESSSLRQYSENASLLSFDSVQTTERLLDKLELTEEEELLLEKALRENNERQNSLLYSDQEPSVCVPAKGFPSLRNTRKANPPNHRRIFSTGSTAMLSDDARLVSSRGSVVENNVSDLRYSYVAIEEDDDGGDDREDCRDYQNPYERGSWDQNQHCKGSPPINIEKFRFKKYEPVKFNVTPPITSFCSSDTFDKEGTCTPIHTPGHTPKNSVSSIKLNNSNTQSSSDSDFTSKQFSRTPEDKSSSAFHYSGSNVFSTPTAEFKKGHSAKKSSFSLKNLFKSPKVRSVADEPSTPSAKNKPSSLPNTPMMPFKFPSGANTETTNNHIEEEKHHTKNLGNLHMDNILNIRNTSGHSKTMSDSSTVPTTNNSTNYSQTQTQIPKQKHVYKLLIEPRPSVKSSNHSKLPSNAASVISSEMALSELKANNSLRAQVQRNDSTRRILAKQHINIAIELRNKGNFRDSTVHLKEACKLGDKTAFLLYGLALRYGSGSEIDLQESFNWIKGATGIKNFKSQVFNRSVDPTTLSGPFNASNDCAAPAMYECGIAYLKGIGISPDEWKGLKCLEYAASLGHVDSMCLCGTLWSRNTGIRWRDVKKAAAWFRLAKDYGADLIGAEWIYKEKYM